MLRLCSSGIYYMFWYNPVSLQKNRTSFLLTFSNKLLKLFTLKNRFLARTKALHSMRTCLTVQDVLHVKHSGCCSSLRINEWVVLEWSICHQDIVTCFLLDFLNVGRHIPQDHVKKNDNYTNLNVCIHLPLHTGRMWYKVNFLVEFNMIEFIFFSLLNRLPNQGYTSPSVQLLTHSWKENNNTFPQGYWCYRICKTVFSRIWTHISVSISYDDNHYTIGKFNV